MSKTGRPPVGDPLLARVEQGLAEWKMYHYGYEREGQTIVQPDQAQGVANGTASALRREIADKGKGLGVERRLWAENVALGLELLAEAELDISPPFGIDDGEDSIDRLDSIGWRRQHNDRVLLTELSKRHVNWFLTGAAVGGVVVYLVTLFAG